MATQSHATPPLEDGSPPAPSPAAALLHATAQRPRAPGMRPRGRFARWHLEPDPPVEEEGWLITYLDVITLMLVMMVVMLSFAGPGGRNPAPPLPAPAGVASAVPPGVAPPSIVPPLPLPVPPAAAPASVSGPDRDPLAGLPLDRLDKNIEVIVNEGTVSFRISSEILFASGEASLSAPGLAVLGRLVPVLASAARHRIVVEGHTDNIPIQTERFPSNWELSTGRAASVVRYLQSQGIDPARMRATGFADTRPLAPNDTPQGRAQNRHVEVILEAPK